MIQYIIAAGIGAFLGSQSKKSKKSYAEGGGIGSRFELGTPVNYRTEDYSGNERIESGEVVLRNGKKAIKLYKDSNYSGDGERIRFFDEIDMSQVKNFSDSTYAHGGLVGERIIFVETDMQFVGETATVLDRKKGVLTVKLDDNGTRNDGKIVYVDVPIAFWEGQVEVLLQKNNREELLKYLMYKYDEDEAKIKRFIKYYENAHDKPYPSNNYMIKHIKSQLNDENFKPFTWEGKEQSVVGYTLPYNDYAKGGKTRKKVKK